MGPWSCYESQSGYFYPVSILAVVSCFFRRAAIMSRNALSM